MMFILSSYRWLILYSLHLCENCIRTQMIWIVACNKLNLFCLQYNKCWVSKGYNVNISLWFFTLLLYLSIFWFYLLKLCVEVSMYNKLHKNNEWSVLLLPLFLTWANFLNWRFLLTWLVSEDFAYWWFVTIRRYNWKTRTSILRAISLSSGRITPALSTFS